MKKHITVTNLDHKRILALIDMYGEGKMADACEALELELERANIVESTAVPANVVTMNSTVEYVDEQTGKVNEVTLVYPRDADIAQRKVSVLAPIGSALLGLSVDQSLPWPLPDGRTTSVRVRAIPYQPEAAGNFDL
jgi:regulator of nucleoside diphosphate kinase